MKYNLRKGKSTNGRMGRGREGEGCTYIIVSGGWAWVSRRATTLGMHFFTYVRVGVCMCALYYKF